ncbi:7947_t:CDS:2 [Funneliformis mosseae]|uniref:7947_t:CDS:1 n=1 Tax=Funneliformis mosseae TaxID=27381 RepID=A0A9N8V5M7_FUNMO|nr:7947_t:CDS:2 [Funneliformis mosseae]
MVRARGKQRRQLHYCRRTGLLLNITPETNPKTDYLNENFANKTKTQGLIHAWKDGKDGKEDDLSKSKRAS